MYRVQEQQFVKVMVQGRHLIKALHPLQQHTQQLHLAAHLAAQSLSPDMALQQAHAAQVLFSASQVVQGMLSKIKRLQCSLVISTAICTYAHTIIANTRIIESIGPKPTCTECLIAWHAIPPKAKL